MPENRVQIEGEEYDSLDFGLHDLQPSASLDYETSVDPVFDLIDISNLPLMSSEAADDITEINPVFVIEEGGKAGPIFEHDGSPDTKARFKGKIRIFYDQTALTRLAHDLRAGKKERQNVIGAYVRKVVDRILEDPGHAETTGLILDLDYPQDKSAFKRQTRELQCVNGESASGGEADRHEEITQLGYDEYVTLAGNFRAEILLTLQIELISRNLEMEAGIMGRFHGQGGMYEVYSCRMGDTDMAIKLPRPKTRESKHKLDNLYNPELISALAEATENNDNLVRLNSSYVVDYEKEGLYRVDLLEELDGAKSLIEYFNSLNFKTANISADPVFARFLQSVFIPALKGVRGLHRKGLIHRDIKPDNIFIIQKGENLAVKVGDYDMVRFSGHKADDIQGTLGYMSPELCNAKATTCKSDIYAIGKMLYVLLGGKISGNIFAEINKAVQGIDFSDFQADPEIKEIIEKCLKLDPDKRPDIDELIRDVENYISKAGSAGEMKHSWPLPLSVTLPPFGPAVRPLFSINTGPHILQHSLSLADTMIFTRPERHNILPYANTAVRNF